MSVEGIEALRPPVSPRAEHFPRWATEHVITLQRIFQNLTTTQSVVDGAIEQLQQDIDGLELDGLTPQQQFELSLATAVQTQLGSLSNVLESVRTWANSSAESAIHAQIEAHQNNAAIRVEQTVRDGLAQQITTLTADVESTSAALSAEQTARADGDTALAASITTVSSTVAGHTTSITQHQASIDGIEAEWGVTINAQGQVVGLVKLDATDSESTFTVVVDKFQVAKTDGTGIVPIFQVGTVGGVSRVALAGDMLVDGAIAATQIATGAVTAAKIAADAVTADKIDVSTLSAIAANVGTLTAGVLQGTKTYMNLTTGEFYIDA